MTLRRPAALFALLAALAGCGKETPTPGVSVDVTGSVTAGGKPVKDLAVAFQPTGGTAQQVQFKLGPDGGFSGKMVAGTYSWYLTTPLDARPADQGKVAAALKGVPAGYQEASMDRQVDVSGGNAKLDLQVK